MRAKSYVVFVTVCFCDPPVGEFDNLKCKLVVNEDFKDFLVAMRHEFRKLVETGR